jgi:hypothetical protein
MTPSAYYFILIDLTFEALTPTKNPLEAKMVKSQTSRAKGIQWLKLILQMPSDVHVKLFELNPHALFAMSV